MASEDKKTKAMKKLVYLTEKLQKYRANRNINQNMLSYKVLHRLRQELEK